MAATIEKAKADDPKELRRKIEALKRELSETGRKQEALKQHTGKVIEKPVLTDADRTLLKELVDKLTQQLHVLEESESTLFAKLKSVVDAVASDHQVLLERLRNNTDRAFSRHAVQKMIEKLGTVKPEPNYSKSITTFAGRRAEAPARVHASSRRPSDSTAAVSNDMRRAGVPSASGIVAQGLTPAEQRILDSVAWWAAAGVNEPTRHQVAFVARYTVNGHFNNLVGGLRTQGLVDYPAGGGLVLTEAGAQAANPVEDPPTRDALIAAVMRVLKTAAMQKIFGAVVDAGKDLTRDELAAATGYTVNGHFNNMVGSLHSLGVIDYPRQGGVRLAELFEALS